MPPVLIESTVMVKVLPVSLQFVIRAVCPELNLPLRNECEYPNPSPPFTLYIVTWFRPSTLSLFGPVAWLKPKNQRREGDRVLVFVSESMVSASN